MICDIEVGETVVVRVTVHPPHKTEKSDEFEFTFSAESADSGLVSRKNLEFVVEGEPDEQGFMDAIPGFSMGLTIMALLGVSIFLQRRSAKITLPKQ